MSKAPLHAKRTMAMAKYESSQFVTEREVKRAWCELAKISRYKRAAVPVFVMETCTGFEVRFRARSDMRCLLAGYFNHTVPLADFAEAIDTTARDMDADVRRAA